MVSLPSTIFHLPIETINQTPTLLQNPTVDLDRTRITVVAAEVDEVAEEVDLVVVVVVVVVGVVAEVEVDLEEERIKGVEDIVMLFGRGDMIERWQRWEDCSE